MMRKPAHLLTLAAGVALAAAVTVAVPAAAEEKFPAPTMAEQSLSEADRSSIRKDIERQRKQLALDRKNRVPMQKLYLSMRALLINYSLIGEAATPAAQEIQKEADHIQKTYPKVLSQGVAKDLPARPKTFAPKDIHVMGIWGSGDRAVVVYQYRIEFFALPAGHFFEQAAGRSFIAKGESKTEVSVDRLNVRPTKVMHFRNHVDVLPGWPRTAEKLLVCTNKLIGFVPMTNEERELLPENRRSFQWDNPAGEIEDFCGVVSIEGQTLWSLAYKQSSPNRLLRPVGIARDGRRAAIYSGSLITGAEGVLAVGNPDQVYVWDSVTGSKTIDASRFGKDPSQIIRRFRAGTLE